MHLFFIRHGQSANNDLWDRTGGNRGRVEDPELTPAGFQQARLLADYVQRIDHAARSDAARNEAARNEAAQGAVPGDGRVGDGIGSLNGHDRVVDEQASQRPAETSAVNPFRRDYFGFTHLYTSLMVRSVLTATPLAEAIGKPLRAWVDIHETGGIFLDDEATGQPQGLPGRTRAYLAERFAHLVLPEDLPEDGWWNRPFETDLQRPERARRVLMELLQRHGGSNDRVALVSHGAFYNHLMRAIFGGDVTNSWWVMHNTGITRVDFGDDRPALVYHNRTEHLPETLIT